MTDPNFLMVFGILIAVGVAVLSRMFASKPTLSDTQFIEMMRHNKEMQAQIKEQESELRELHNDFLACKGKLMSVENMLAVLVSEIEAKEGQEYRQAMKEEALRIIDQAKKNIKPPPPKR